MVTLRTNIFSSFAGELLDSDGLDYSRRAEEESKLCSVRLDCIGQQVICQTQVVAITGSILENGASYSPQSALMVVLAPRVAAKEK
jgi:hypothetical protein